MRQSQKIYKQQDNGIPAHWRHIEAQPMRVKIRDIRIAKGVSQGDLAKHLGISQPYLSQIEKGSRKLDAEKIGHIADFLGVPPHEIVDYSAPAHKDVQEFIKIFERATPEQQQMILALTKTVLGKLS